MNVATDTDRVDAVTHAPARRRRARPKRSSIANLNFYYGDQQGAERTSTCRSIERQGHGLHRPVGLRQVDPAAHPQPDVRPLSEAARRRRGAARRRRTSSSPRQDLNLLRAADRHGVPEADAVPDVDLREHRLRHPALREAAEVASSTTASSSALRRAALWEEVKNKLNANGLSLSGGQQQRLCIARTVAVRPEVILFDEPCSALDPISTAKIEELIDELKADYTIVIVTHNMQQAARVSDFTAFMYLGELIEFGDDDARSSRRRATSRTQDYITGRFG